VQLSEGVSLRAASQKGSSLWGVLDDLEGCVPRGVLGAVSFL
jgi:hypothetical protein